MTLREQRLITSRTKIGVAMDLVLATSKSLEDLEPVWEPVPKVLEELKRIHKRLDKLWIKINSLRDDAPRS